MEGFKQERLSVGTGLESETKNSPKLIVPLKKKKNAQGASTVQED